MPTIYLNFTWKSRFKWVHTTINDFLRNFIPSLASFKESRLVIRRPQYTLCSRNPQIPKPIGFKSGLFGDQ